MSGDLLFLRETRETESKPKTMHQNGTECCNVEEVFIVREVAWKSSGERGMEIVNVLHGLTASLIAGAVVPPRHVVIFCIFNALGTSLDNFAAI
jgi:hypothetical protein